MFTGDWQPPPENTPAKATILFAGRSLARNPTAPRPWSMVDASRNFVLYLFAISGQLIVPADPTCKVSAACCKQSTGLAGEAKGKT
jgi:hypothetical protein